MDAKLDEIVTQLGSKADNQDLEDLTARVAVLESDAVQLRAVAKALREDKGHRWTLTEKLLGLTFTSVLVALNVLSLGPDLFS
jgi:hypothetical protein